MGAIYLFDLPQMPMDRPRGKPRGSQTPRQRPVPALVVVEVYGAAREGGRNDEPRSAVAFLPDGTFPRKRRSR
jgi:hypothetical protein